MTGNLPNGKNILGIKPAESSRFGFYGHSGLERHNVNKMLLRSRSPNLMSTLKSLTVLFRLLKCYSMYSPDKRGSF